MSNVGDKASIDPFKTDPHVFSIIHYKKLMKIFDKLFNHLKH